MTTKLIASEADDCEIHGFESRIDSLHLNLRLLRYPKNLAFWSLVTTGLEALYRVQNPQSPDRERTAQAFLSRSFGLFFKKVSDYPFKGHAAIKNLRLNPTVREAAMEAGQYARFWFAATGYFPEWHLKEVGASLVGQNSIRFELLATKRQRELSAYQKSFRHSAMRVPTESVFAPVPEWIQTKYSRAFSPGVTKDGRLLYTIPQRVYEFYRDWYAQKMREAVEHPLETDLGAYDISDAIRFWSSLAAFASVHEYLCFLAGTFAKLPVNSILPIKKRTDWAAELSRLSDLSTAKCDAIIEHIICRPHSVIDLHVTPFLALDEKSGWLALAAPLAVTGRFDQNLLRICSADDPIRFNRITPKKEQSLRGEVAGYSTPLKISCRGPFSLPSPLPDVDMVLEDLHDDTLVISEMKWVRPPIGWKSRQRADEELEKGIKQLYKIREFLVAHPAYLATCRDGISKPISEFKNVYHTVFTRGHLIDVEPKCYQSMIPLDALKFAVSSERHLDPAMRWLLADSWLPQEQTDFKLHHSRYEHQGYVIEAPVWAAL